MRVFVLICALMLPLMSFAQTAPSTEEIELRARDVVNALRCVVCQNQSIEESEATLAKDMRVIVRERIASGESDAQVIEFMRERYGDYVFIATPFYFKTLPTGESEGPQESVVLMMGTFGVYAKIGSPNLTDPRALTSAASTAQQPPAMSPTAFIAEMERDLQTGEESVRKWGLYARALMSVGRYEDAFGAYEKALGLSNNDADIAAELESARSYAAQQSGLEKAQPGPSREDMEAAAKMSAADRAAMIQSMVDGLADKLAQNPDDTEGWVRLLRSRKVLGQTAQAQKDITAMKTHFESTPDIISQILRQSGWE